MTRSTSAARRPRLGPGPRPPNRYPPSPGERFRPRKRSELSTSNIGMSPCRPGLACRLFSREANASNSARPRLARHLLVVPLQQEHERDGDAGCRFGQDFVAGQAEHGRGDPRFRRGERHAGGAAHRHARRPPGRPGWAEPAARPGWFATPGQPARPERCCSGDKRAHGLAAAIRPLSSATNRSSSSVLGRSPHPGASMAAAAKPQVVTKRRARPCTFGTLLCWPPPWASSTSGRRSAAPAGDQSTPWDVPDREHAFRTRRRRWFLK